MKILRGYILKEHAAPFAVTVCGLTGVLLIGNIIKFAELVIAKGVSLFEILRLLIYMIPYMFSFTIPMATLIAMVMAFGRFSNDYELIALRASGVAPARLILPLVTAALMLSGGVLLLNDRVVPRSHLAFRRQLKAIGIKRPAAYVEAGTFIKDFPPYVMFVYGVEDDRLSDVRIYEPKPNGPTRTIMATHGTVEPFPDERGAQMKLYDGTIDEWDPEHPGTLYKVSFGTYSMNLLLDAGSRQRLGKKLKEMTFRELRGEERQMAAQGIPAMPIELELHRRIAASFATVVFVTFGLALGLGLHHHERLTTFVWVLGLFMAYYLTTIGANAVAVKGWLTPWMSMWLPNVLLESLGAGQVWRAIRR